jgi:predicted nucleic acid-binding protein
MDDHPPWHTWTDVLHIARSRDVSVYDAAYLELAIQLGAPLATLDQRLKAAAAASGIRQYVRH